MRNNADIEALNSRLPRMPLASSYRNVVIGCRDIALFAPLVTILESFGFRVERVNTIRRLIGRLQRSSAHAVIADMDLFQANLAAHVAELRYAYAGPLLLLTRRPAASKAVVALDSGADDVIHWVVGGREVVARMRAIETRQAAARQVRQPVGQTEGQRKWTLSTQTRLLLTPDGEAVDLTSGEFDLMAFLVQRAGQLVSRTEIAIAYKGVSMGAVRSRGVDTLVSVLRRKIALYIPDRPSIKSVRGRGYVFVGFEVDVVR